MKFIGMVLFITCFSSQAVVWPLTLLPLQLNTPTEKTSIRFIGCTNFPLRLQASSNLRNWTDLVVTNQPGFSSNSTFGVFGTLVVSNSSLAGFVTYTTNYVQEFHGYTTITLQDFSTSYEWVDRYAATNINAQHQVFFRLRQGPTPLPPTLINILQVISLSCGLIIPVLIYKCLFQ
jgi:hypothetical protein